MFCFNKASVSEEEKIDSFAIVLNSKFPAGIAVFSLFSTSSQFVYVDLLICVAPRERDRDRQTDRQTETEIDRDRNRDKDRQRQTVRDRQTNRHTDRQRQTETQRQRQGD